MEPKDKTDLKCVKPLAGLRFGLRCFDGGEEVHLLQISGGGRLLVGIGCRTRWGKQKSSFRWEVYATAVGQTYATHEEAEDVATRLAMEYR